MEWCGILFYTEEGNISDADNFKIHVNYLYPMDVGTAGSTSIENYEEVLEAIKHMPELGDMNQGFIHSHNNMKTFFSGTDEKQLVDGANDYDYFLSVITNNDADYIARISFKFNSDIEIGLNKYKVTQTEQVGYFDCDVEVNVDQSVDEFLLKRIEEIDKQRTVGTYWTNKHNYLTLNQKTGQAGFLPYHNQFNYLSVEPEEFISEELLFMYDKSLLDPEDINIDSFTNLVEDAYDITIKDNLNELQKKAAQECERLLIKSVLAGYGIIDERKQFDNTTYEDHYLNLLKKNTLVIPNVTEEVEHTMQTSMIYDNYTSRVAFEGFKLAYNRLSILNERYPTKCKDLIYMLYCSCLAHISTRSKHYKANQVDMIQGINHPTLFDDLIMDQYSYWLPHLKANGLEMPLHYYSDFY